MVRLWRFLNSSRWSAALVAGLLILAMILLFSLLGSTFVDVKKALVASVPPSLAPTAEFPLGTDSQGRDMLAVMIVAIPQTLKMGLIAGLVGIAIGLCWGWWQDFLAARLTHLCGSLPTR
jgi:peptide/nickel transport system permease protein